MSSTIKSTILYVLICHTHHYIPWTKSTTSSGLSTYIKSCTSFKILMKQVPEMISFWLPSSDTRYHWIEHFESDGAVSERGRIRRCEPRASEPSKTYKQDLFSSALLFIASWKELWCKIAQEKTPTLQPFLMYKQFYGTIIYFYKEQYLLKLHKYNKMPKGPLFES